MMNCAKRRRLLPAAVLVASLVACAARVQAQVAVCCSVPDLGDLTQEIGGNLVSVTTFCKSSEDPHFLDAKPSFVKALNQANLLIMVGLGLEDGWSPVLLQGARNAAVQPGGRGYLDASTAIRPIDAPTGPVNRSMGDVHPFGNPHYLLDPVCGLQVARLIRDKLSELRPDRAEFFNERYLAFGQRVGTNLIGERLGQKYKLDDLPKLALLFEYGKLATYLKSQNEDTLLSGWLGTMLPHYGTKVVDDHNLWPYFVRRFGLQVVAHLEPKPGIPPTTQHLGAVAQQMRQDQVRCIFASPYFDLRHARFVAGAVGAQVVPMAHQVGSRPGTRDYLSTVDYNVRQVATSLEGR